jgi:hypothetical protein
VKFRESPKFQENILQDSLPSAFVNLLLGLIFDPKDKGDMFLGNVGLSPN